MKGFRLHKMWFVETLFLVVCFCAKGTFEQKRQQLRLLHTPSNLVLVVVLVVAAKAPYYPRANGAKRRARVLIPHGYLHPGKGKHSEV